MEKKQYSADSRAKAVHERAIVIDGCCNQVDPVTYWIEGGGTVAVPTVGGTREHSGDTLKAIAEWYVRIANDPDRLMLVKSVDDIRQAKAAGKLGIAMGFQSSTPVGWDLGMVEKYYQLGVRMIGLVYNQRNRVADGSGETANGGLSVFGKRVVQEMNRVGIVVDISHVGYRSSMEAIELSTRPPVASHSNPRALCDNGRNLPDEIIKAIAAKGGLVGINGFPAFIRTDREPTLDDWLDHMEYVVKLVGVDHVGIGIDYFDGAEVTSPEEYEMLLDWGLWYKPDYIPPYQYRKDYAYPYPVGMEDARGYPNITAGLLKRGYSEDDVLKILGGNWMRVFEANWQ